MVNNYCVECGSRLGEDFKVCPYCGKKIFIEPKNKYCHICGTVLNNGGNCSKCSAIIEEASKNYEAKKFNICSLLAFIFSMISFFIIMILTDIFYEIWVIAVIFMIPSFILQFFGRKKDTATIWKVFSWIAFGISVFIMFMVSMAFLMVILDEISMGGTNF